MIGILSDAHGNRPAFDLAIQILKKNGAEKIIFLGDAIGYIPTVSVLYSIIQLREQINCITGNHEAVLVSGKFNLQKEPIYQHIAIKKQITDELLSFIHIWPRHIELEHPAGSALFIHGSPNDYTNEYVYPDTDLEKFSVNQSFVFMGHTHRPFIKRIGATTYVNVGSCGLPRDHGAYGSAVLFDEKLGEIQLVRFDIRSSTHNWLQNFEYVHESIYNLLNRKNEKLEGIIIDE
jgi:putative phosphoesterase